MPPLRPLFGQETLNDLGCSVSWKTLGDDHEAVEFQVTLHNASPEFTVTVSRGGGMVFGPEPVLGFTSVASLRKAVGLLTWCYRTAYREVFHLQNVDQILFM